MTLRKLHRANALVLGIFIFAHLINHLTIIGGAETHLAVMDFLRFFYRPLLIEVIIYGLFASQIALGVAMMVRRGWPRDRWTRIQFVSGFVVALFLLQHMTAAVMTRMMQPDVDTNIYWAASVVSREPFVWYFAPYYAVGVFCLFLHIASMLGKRPGYSRFCFPIIGVGLVVTGVIISGLMGWPGGTIELPPAHEQYIENYWANLFGG